MGMFYNCSNLLTINASNFNTSNVESLRIFLYNCQKLISIDMSNFDTSNLINMEGMFFNCSSLTYIDISHFNTSKVKYFINLFCGCSNLISVNLSNFDTSSTISLERLFQNCYSLLSIDVPNFNTTNAISMKGLFYDCGKITSLNLSNFDTSKVTDMGYLFYGCVNLTSIELSNFNTTNVISMRSLFYDCVKITSLNLSSFDTSKVIDMGYLFYGCVNLTSIDISNFNKQNIKSLKSFFNLCENLVSIDLSSFDTSKITDFSFLFYRCKKLKSINLLNINTSSATNMFKIFANCSSLESLDLTNFDTTYVTSMDIMFGGCYSLKSIKFPEIFNTSKVKSINSLFYDCISLIVLNLSSFDTSKITDMRYTFYNCYNLKYLDIPNFASTDPRINYMFYNMSSLIFLNINSLEINKQTKAGNSFGLLPSNLKICSRQTKILKYLSSIDKTSDCSDICFLKNIKIDINNNECIHSCKDNGYNHECNNICYNECPDDTHIIIKNISNKENIFIEFEDGVAVCLDRNPKGYYLDQDKFYKECYDACEFCYGPGNEKNNSCKKCKSNLFFLNDIDIYKYNCYEKCQYYYYFNESNDYTCTINDTCNGNYTKFIFEKYKCIDKCENDNIYKYEYNNICYKECPETTIKSSKKDYFYLGEENINQIDLGNNEDIYQVIKDNILNKYNLSKGEEMVYQGENDYFFHLTSAENELAILEGKTNNSNKFSVIDLGKCGSLLKKNYNINENSSLIIMKYEKVSNISSERSLQYEVYEPINKTKSNLSICDNENINIDIYIPVILSEKTQNLYNELQNLGYDLFDINSPFYNDICTPYKSSDGTDILLSDRVNTYYYNDDTSCQSNCKFSDYLIESQYLKCQCDIKNSEINTNNANSFSAKSIYKSFYDVLKYSNYKVLKCGKLIITINSFTKNIGSILSISYFLIFFAFTLIYFFKGKNQLKNDYSNFIIEQTHENNSIKIIQTKDAVQGDVNNDICLQANKNIENLNLNKVNNNINNINNNKIKKKIIIKIKKKRIIRRNNPLQKKLSIYPKNRLNNNYIINEDIKEPKNVSIISNLGKNNFPNSLSIRELINKNNNKENENIYINKSKLNQSQQNQ